jgi:hypothetical protein
MATAGLSTLRLRTPRAAAIAGLLFSLLLAAAFVLLRLSVPADPQGLGSWLRTNSQTIALAMNLISFAGIAFLWFIGVLRDRLGEQEDRFFATVFFGSGLLFLGSLFVTAAVVGALLMAFAANPEELIGSATFQFARALAYALMNVYVVKMAGVFMVTTSTIALYTAIAPVGWRFSPTPWPYSFSLAGLFRLELCRLPALGVSAKPQHLGRQLSASDIN